MNPKNVYDVIVIGCGASGIAALSRLTECNFKALGLEADSRIGGRIHSVKLGDGYIDLGAEWCHGENDNIVFSLAGDLNVLKEPVGEYVITFVDSSGKVMSSELSSKLNGIWMDVAHSTNSTMIGTPESLGKHFSEVFWQLIRTKHTDIDSTLAAEILDWFQKYENSINASDTWFEASGNGHLEYWECDGNSQLHWKGRGFKTLLDILLKKFPDPSNEIPVEILLNKAVIKINWNTNSNQVSEIMCSDGTVYYSKFVIVTLSIGVLKEMYMSMFVPCLPAAKVNSIEGLTLGTVDKIFATYEKPWWNGKLKWVGFLWQSKDKEMFVNRDKWLLEVFGVNASEHNPYILCGWVSGSAARYMETLPIEEVQSGFHRLLCLFLGKEFDVPHPISILRSNWYNNPLTRGSYSFRSMDSEKRGASAEGMACPLYDKAGAPALCFAGEATSSHYFSTVHGAVEAGFREANRVIDYVSTSNDNYASQLSQRATHSTGQYKIIIIGAGIAGLAAARVCLLAGINEILVLEARDRVGGRIHSMLYEEGYIDFGAQWLHGDNNELSDFARDHNLLSQIPSFEGQGQFLRNDGYEFDASFVEQVEVVITNILKRCELFSKNEGECNFSVGEFLEHEFEKYIKTNASDYNISLWRELLNWHIRFQEIDNSCESLKHLSAKAWGLYDFNGGESQSHINFKNGYISVLNKLVGTFPDGIIKLNTTVNQIRWNNSAHGNTVGVYLNDKEFYQADHVIVTLPLGVLKTRHLDMFLPTLPQEHQNAIDSLGFSGIGKIFIQFEDDWWGENSEGFQFVWKLATFQTADDVFKREDAEWVRHISGFDILAVGPPNTLVGWVDSEGTPIMETLTDEKLAADCVLALKHFTKNHVLPPVKSIRRTNWNSDPFTLGCYCHITRDCDELGVGPTTLTVPILNNSGSPVLLFAGEACHNTFFSTTHGAFQSGAQQASVICDHIISNEILDL